MLIRQCCRCRSLIVQRAFVCDCVRQSKRLMGMGQTEEGRMKERARFLQRTHTGRIQPHLLFFMRVVLTEGFWVGWHVCVFKGELVYHVPWFEGSVSVCRCNANSWLTHTQTHIHTACIMVLLSVLTQMRKHSRK